MALLGNALRGPVAPSHHALCLPALAPREDAIITPIDRDTAQKVADVGHALAALIHGFAGIAKGEVRTWDTANACPFSVGLALSQNLNLADLRAMGLMADPPKLPLILDQKVLQVIQAAGHPFNSGVMALSLCAMTGFVYELVSNCDDQSNPHSDPVLDFLRHVRNAAFHGNSFDIWKKSDVSTAKWRDLTTDKTNLNRKKLFFDFLAPGDAFLLFSDVLRVVQAGATDPVTLI